MKTIQKTFIALVAVAAITLAVFSIKGCGSDWDGSNVPVTLSLRSASGTVTQDPVALPPGVRFIEFRVTADDMAEIIKVVDTGGFGPVSESFDVPPGMARTFTVKALDADRGVAIWNGSAMADIGDDPVTLTVYMEFILANDMQAPTMPANVSVISNSPGSMELSWEPCTDNNIVASYRIYELINGEVFLLDSTSSTSVTTDGLPGGEYCLYVTAVDPTGNESAMQSSPACVTVQGPIDTEAPAAPGALVVEAASSTVISMGWEAPVGADDLAGYNIYYALTAGGAYGYLASTTQSAYLDTRTEGGEYCYNVTAFDDSGNESAPTASLCVTIEGEGGGSDPDTEAPSTPEGLVAATGELATEIILSWTPSSDNLAVEGYRVYEKLDGTFAYSATSFANTISVERLLPNTYCFAVSATDAAGNESALSAEACVEAGQPPPEVPDTEAPAAPGALVVEAASSTVISMGWEAPVGADDLAGYNIYYALTAGGAYGYLASTTQSAYLDTRTEGGEYCYNVTAFDDSGNESAPTASLCVTIEGEGGGSDPDTEAPSTPEGLVAATGELVTEIILSWMPSSDNLAVEGYRVYEKLDGTFAYSATSFANTISVERLLPNTYCFAVSATDAAGNESALSAEACVEAGQPPPEVPDTEAPAAPGALVVEAASSTVISMGWEAPVGADDLAGYNIHYALTAGGAYGYLASTTQSAYLDTRTEGGEYCYNVTAFDDSGNESAPTASLCVTIKGEGGGSDPDTEAPSTPEGLVAATGELATEIILSWTPSSDNLAVEGYRVYEKLDGTFAYSATSFANTISVERLLPNTYCFAVSATDAAGNESALSAEACVLVGGSAYDPRMPNCPEFLTYEENPGGQYKWHPDSNPPKCYGELPKPPKTWTKKVPPGQAK